MATTVYRDPRLEREPALRFEVERFACHMEKRLCYSDHGTGWHNTPACFLVRKLHEELGELMAAMMDPRTVVGNQGHHDVETVAKWLRAECADVANVAMTIFDNSIEGRKL